MPFAAVGACTCSWAHSGGVYLSFFNMDRAVPVPIATGGLCLVPHSQASRERVCDNYVIHQSKIASAAAHLRPEAAGASPYIVYLLFLCCAPSRSEKSLCD